MIFVSGDMHACGDSIPRNRAKTPLWGRQIVPLYALFSLLNSAISAVCLFEATGRLGGRIYSVHNLGPNRDLTLDMGAYRYMPLVQPIITNLIENNLQLPNRLYQVT